MKSIFPRFKNKSRKKSGLGEMKRENFSGFFPRFFLAFIIIAAISSMYISSTVKRAGLIEYTLPDLNVGDISPKREIAYIDFQVPKPAEQLEEERRRAAADVIPVFSLDRDPLYSIHTEIDSLFSILRSLEEGAVPDSVKKSVEEALAIGVTFSDITAFKRSLTYRRKDFADSVSKSLKKGFDQIYEHLIVSRKEDIGYYSEKLIMLEDFEIQHTVNIEEILGISEAGDSLKQVLQVELGDNFPSRNLSTVQNFASRFIRPNLSFNATRTGELRRQAMEAVPLYSASYKKNERIIEANVPVVAPQLAALKAYNEALKSQTFEENRRKHYANAFGKIIIGLGIIGIIVGYIYLYRRKIYNSFPHLVLLTLISALPLSVAYYTAWGGSVSEFLIPVAVATILATILFDAEIGIMMSLGISLLVASLASGSGIRIGILYFIAGSIGVLTVGRVRHRKEFYRAMFFVPLTMAVVVTATNDWLTASSFGELGKDIFIASINGFFCPIIAIGLLPLLESVFKIATDITLLELSDLNNPLLKEMAVKAPGTFSSVLMVGALAEAAAEKTGANPLLARVGAYYHDIGKTVIPEYFIENQYGGENPHDRLSPHMSALVITSHVKEGYELGVKYGLPEAILDIIKQHHGTSLMALIYQKAEEKTENKSVDEAAFRYPGPKPQTREAGIVMLADLVEAASRTVHEKSPGKLKTLISTIIQKRFMDGELDECDLTLKDLHNIEESFLPVLVGSYHGRIEYPWQKEEKEGKKEDQEETKQSENNHAATIKEPEAGSQKSE